MKNRQFFNDPKQKKESWHYLAVKTLPALFRGTTSKSNGDFYCLNCLHSFRTKNKLRFREKVCKNKAFCAIVLPSQKFNIDFINI